MSENTIPYDSFVRKLFNKSTDPSKNFTHAILGIVTEIQEYRNATDEVNGLEELGDLSFYVEALRQTITDYLGTAVPGSAVDVEETVSAFCAEAHKTSIDAVISSVSTTLLDDAKRWVGYNKEPKSFSEVFNTAVALCAYANMTGPFPCSDSYRLQLSNVKKLLKRYPGGEFSQYHALVRDTEAERAVLQGQ